MSETKGKAATRAKNRYNTNNYDSLRIVVPKGQKATVKAAADEAGESINQYTQGALLLVWGYLNGRRMARRRNKNSRARHRMERKGARL